MRLFRESRVLSLLAAAGLLVFLATAADAAGASAAKDEKKLNIGITLLNNNAKLPQADKVMSKKFDEEFNVKSDKITSLRGKGLNYGEMAAVLAIADKMDGGASDANINKIMSMHKGKTTAWGRIANNLKVDLADVADRVSSFEDDTHSEIKEAAVEGAAGRGAGGGEAGDEESGGAAGGAGEESGEKTTGGSAGGTY